MKLLLLHIGDIHIKDEAAIQAFQISKLADALNSFIWDRVVLFISGDIAFCGERSQYSVASRIINQIIHEIKTRCGKGQWIEIICVPGNHDVFQGTNPHSSIDLQGINNTSAYESYLCEELNKQKEFYSFAKKFKCFSRGETIDKRVLEYDNYRLEIIMINSAVFSILEEDKGLHYIPENCLSRIAEPTNADFVISIMHHSPDWYIDRQKNQIEGLIYRKSSIVMFGHEHYIEKKIVSFEEGKEAYIQAGGCLGDNGDWSQSAFHAGVLDTCSNEYNHRKFVWNIKQRQYECEIENKILLSPKPSKEQQLLFKNSFLDFLHEDGKRNLSSDFQDYYVFPRLVTDEGQSGGAKEYTTEAAFLEELKSKKRILIAGGYNTGKTLLLKKLAISMGTEYAVIFCRIEDIRQKKSDRIIKDRFYDIYGESESDYNRFLQMPLEKKILMIDDIDQIKQNNLSQFISGAKELFGLIILTTNQVIDLSLFDRMKEQLKATDTLYKFRLAPLFADKRNELIKKVVEITAEEPGSVQKLVDVLCEAVTAHKSFMNLDPDFIIKYVECYCKSVGDTDSGDNTVFSKVFEADITNSIKKHLSPTISVERAFVLFAKVAHYIHFNKVHPITENEIIAIINMYNSEYDSNVSAVEFMGTAVNTKIMMRDSQTNAYRFTNKNHLAFFVAKELNRQYNETGDDTDLKAVFHSACFGINADILMFVSYITDNVKVLKLFLDMASYYSNSWAEFDFEDNMPEFLKTNRIHKLIPPTEEDRDIEERRIVENEKLESSQITTKDIYDYSDEEADELINKTIRSLQLMVVLSRCLPNFEHNMKKNDKEAFVSSVYTMPNRIFYGWAKQMDLDVERIISFFKEQSKDYYGNQRQASDDDIIKALQWASMSLLLDLYSLPAFYAAKDHTMKYLNNYDYSHKDTYALEHLMMLERYSSSKHFAQEALRLKDEKKSHIYSVMLSRIVGHAVVFKRDLEREHIQQLQGRFFPGSRNYKRLNAQRMKTQNKER